MSRPESTGVENATDEEVVAGCLAWCNERREEQHMEPLDELPKGQPADPKSCPCGTATGLKVFTTAYAKPDQKWSSYEELRDQLGQGIPAVVREFIARFDAGLLRRYRLS